MIVLAFFTDKSVPKEGLVPKVKIYNAATGELVVDNLDMDEIGDGWYKYNFSFHGYNLYCVNFDGGTPLSNYDRFKYLEISLTD